MEFSHSASPHLRRCCKQHMMHCEPLQSTINTLLQNGNSLVGHFHCHTHRCTVPLTAIYSPLHYLDSPESSGGPPGPEGPCPHFLQSSYVLLGPGAKSEYACVRLVSPSARPSTAENRHSSALVARPPQSLTIKDH